jgi:hypothetical protein
VLVLAWALGGIDTEGTSTHGIIAIHTGHGVHGAGRRRLMALIFYSNRSGQTINSDGGSRSLEIRNQAVAALGPEQTQRCGQFHDMGLRCWVFPIAQPVRANPFAQDLGHARPVGE